MAIFSLLTCSKLACVRPPELGTPAVQLSPECRIWTSTASYGFAKEDLGPVTHFSEAKLPLGVTDSRVSGLLEAGIQHVSNSTNKCFALPQEGFRAHCSPGC